MISGLLYHFLLTAVQEKHPALVLQTAPRSPL